MKCSEDILHAVIKYAMLWGALNYCTDEPIIPTVFTMAWICYDIWCVLKETPEPENDDNLWPWDY